MYTLTLKGEHPHYICFEKTQQSIRLLRKVLPASGFQPTTAVCGLDLSPGTFCLNGKSISVLDEPQVEGTKVVSPLAPCGREIDYSTFRKKM